MIENVKVREIVKNKLLCLHIFLLQKKIFNLLFTGLTSGEITQVYIML